MMLSCRFASTFGVLLLMYPTSWAELSAPNLNVVSTTYNSVTVNVTIVSGAAAYEITYVAQHDLSDNGTMHSDDETINVLSSHFTVAIQNLRSNINYFLKVRVSDGENVGNFTEEILARTAPNGAAVLQTISTPNFITIFLEQTPGATGWEVEAIITQNLIRQQQLGVTFPLTGVGDILTASYVAIVTGLLPNTKYTLRARVSQLFTDENAVNFTADESPFGSAINVTTDRISAFGRIDVLNYTATADDNNNETLKDEIAAEILAASQNASEDVYSVVVLELEGNPGSNIICHYEILLNIQSDPNQFELDDLTLSDSNFFNNSVVKFEKATQVRLGYNFLLLDNVGGRRQAILRYVGVGNSNSPVERDVLSWTLYDTSFHFEPAFVSDDDRIITPVQFVFSDSGIESNGSLLFPLAANNIYAIRQNYLFRTELFEGTPLFYNRNYGSFHLPLTNLNRFTILFTTDPGSFNTSVITTFPISDECGVGLSIPANLISRATSFETSLDGRVLATLSEVDLDSSQRYLMYITNLSNSSENTISVAINSRNHDGEIASTSASLNVSIDKPIDECLSNLSNCHANATCYNSILSFDCICNEGFTGNGINCTDDDECTLGTDDCDISATCMNIPGNFSCFCNSGYSGNGTTCADNDECVLGTDDCDRNAICVNFPGNFSCSCINGFSGNGTTCIDIDECSLHTYNCDSKASCINTQGSFSCLCKIGYSYNGVSCVDIDECALGTNNCDPNATCSNIAGNFNCTCKTGYFGNGTTCVDDDECTLNADNCNSNATCSNNPGSFACACNAGFSGDGVTCTDENECALDTDQCDSNATCLNIPGSFTCACNPGFSGDGITCTDNDECILNTDNCDSNATCSNMPGSFTCTCNVGYSGDGVACTDDDECALQTHNCDSNATCSNNPGNFTCTCSTGFSGDGTSCMDDDECLLNIDNCDSNATCSNIPGSFNCTCNIGFSGDGTECADLNECELGLSDCDANTLCENTIGSYGCESRSDFQSLFWIAYVVAGVVAVALIGIGVSYYCHHKTKKTKRVNLWVSNVPELTEMNRMTLE